MKPPPKIRIVHSSGIADGAKANKFKTQADKFGSNLLSPRGIQACLWAVLVLAFVVLYVVNYTTLF